MKKLKRIVGIILGIAGIAALAFGVIIAVNTDFSNPDDINEFLQRKFDKLGIAGMAVTFIEGDEIKSFHSFGKMDIENNKDITADTIFAIASTSKIVTGCAIMQMVEQGLVDLDEDINAYLPFKIVHPSYPNDKITIRMLLTHTSSITDNWDEYFTLYTIEAGGGDPDVSLDEFVKNYFLESGEYYYPAKEFLDENPGTIRSYSNCGYALLGYIAETAANQPFNEYCNEHIFTPLGMENTAWYISELDESKIAVPYDDGEPMPHYSYATYPDGSIRTSANDFSKFISMIMNKGTYKGITILEVSTVEEMFSPQIPEIWENQGLTWDLKAPEEYGAECDGYVIGHSGGDSGMKSYAFFIPETKKGVILMMNDNIDYLKQINYNQIIKRLSAEIS